MIVGRLLMEVAFARQRKERREWKANRSDSRPWWRRG
jgi:hypothetical protein